MSFAMLRIITCFSLLHLCLSTPPRGYLELRLKSAFALNATVEIADDIYFPTNKRVWNVPLVPDEVKILSNIPVEFRRPGIVVVNSGPLEKFGLDFETIRSERWNTQTMTIMPERIHLPFTGFRIDFMCFRNWHGPYCDKFCNENNAALINRRCTHNGTLGCPYNFRGPNCKKPITDCHCENDGFCVSEFKNPTDSQDKLICECPVGFEGDRCEKEQYEYAMPLSVDMHGNKRSEKKWMLLKQFYARSMVANELYDNSF
ncbi:unnamed protein product [Caenorhabditis brenneri]